MLSLDPIAIDQSSPIPGERRLWAAVLAQAVSDLTGINAFTNRCYHTRIRYFARLWIDSDSRDAGSFRWVCDQLELDPGWLRAPAAADGGSQPFRFNEYGSKT